MVEGPVSNGSPHYASKKWGYPILQHNIPEDIVAFFPGQLCVPYYSLGLVQLVMGHRSGIISAVRVDDRADKERRAGQIRNISPIHANPNAIRVTADIIIQYPVIPPQREVKPGLTI